MADVVDGAGDLTKGEEELIVAKKPMGARLCACCTEYASYVRGLIEDIDDMHAKNTFYGKGWPFIIHMISMYWGIRGFMDNFQREAVSPILRDLGIETTVGATIQSQARLPWSMKSFFAAISDVFPVGKYKKVPYMIFITILGTAALVLLGVLPADTLRGANKQATLVFLLLLVVNSMGSLDDCLTQGKYTQIAKVKGSGIISFQYSSQNAASLIVSLMVGAINGSSPITGPQWSFRLSAIFGAQALPIIATNCIGDEPREGFCKPDCLTLKENGRILVLAMVMGGFVIALLLIPGRFLVEKIAFGFAGCFVLHCLSFWSLPFIVAKINVYLWLCRAMGFSFGFPLLQFYTIESARCGGMNIPNFSLIVYQTIGGVTSSLAILFATFLFQKYIVHWNAQKAFWVTTAMQVVAAAFDIINVTRFNQTLLGWTGLGRVNVTIQGRTMRMDDICSFIFGTSLLEPLVLTLDALPSTLLLSKLCPKNVESTVFAILAGFSNIGMSLSGLMGAWFVRYIGFSFSDQGAVAQCEEGGFKVGNAHVHGLAWSLFIGNALLPALTIPLTWLFIPDIRLDENFIEEGEETHQEAELEPGDGGPPPQDDPQPAGPAAARYVSFLDEAPGGGGLRRRPRDRLHTDDGLQSGTRRVRMQTEEEVQRDLARARLITDDSCKKSFVV